jgi:DNA-binding NarL/FixJ family response regulator
MKIRVLVADDQQMVRAGFRLILAAEPDLEVVGEASDGEIAVRLAEQLRPDVVLMDIRMPGLDGLQATRRLLADAPQGTTRVLMLTTFDTEEYVFGALEAGASGFLLKNSPPEQLIEAIRTVAGGDALLAPSVTRLVIEELARRPPARTTAPVELAALTEREREVLLLVAQGLTNAEIAARIYVSEATVKTHVSRVLMKLGLRDRVHAVIFTYEKGLVSGDG